MKIRTGFVSNSSTSSFCLFGICVDRSKAAEVAKLLDAEFNTEDECEAGEVIGRELKLEYSNGPYDNHMMYIGRSPDSLKDDETGAQFKESVKAALGQYFPDATYHWHEEGWYDG